MLGHPEASIAKALRMPREIEAVAQRLAGVGALHNGREIED